MKFSDRKIRGNVKKRSFKANLESKNYMKLKLYIYIPFIVVAISIFILSSQSNLPIKFVFEFQDKVMHFIAFFVLGYTCVRICLFKGFTFTKVFILTIIISTGYGLTDEIHQSFVPNRVFDWADLFADFLGSASSVFIGMKIYKFDEKIRAKIV